MPDEALEVRVRERYVRLGLLPARRVHSCPLVLLPPRGDPLGELGKRLFHVDRLRPAARAGHHDAGMIVVPCPHGRITGVAVLPARAGAARLLHVHAMVAAPDHRRPPDLYSASSRIGRRRSCSEEAEFTSCSRDGL